MQFASVSAKTGINVHETFEKFTLEIIRCKAELFSMQDIFMTFLLHLN